MAKVPYLIQWNCESIQASTHDLHYIVRTFQPAVLLLQETWTSPTSSFDSLFPNMAFFHLPRPQPCRNGWRGGLIVAVRNDIADLTIIQSDLQLSSSTHEILAVTLSFKSRSSIKIANVYIRPSFSISDPDIDSSLSSLLSGASDYIISGDFNARHSSWDHRSNHAGVCLEQWMSANALHLISDHNTSGPTFISQSNPGAISHPDLTFASTPNLISPRVILPPHHISSSSHLPILYSLDISPPLSHHKTLVSKVKFADSLRRFAMDRQSSVTRQSSTPFEVIESAMAESSFTISKSTRSPPAPWWDQECRSAFERRKLASVNLRRRFSLDSWSRLRTARKEFRHITRKAEVRYYNSLFSDPSLRPGSKDFFALIRRYKMKLSVPSINSSHQTKCLLEDTAIKLNDKWSDACPPPSLPIPRRPLTVTSDLIGEHIQSLRNSSPGPDGISKSILNIINDIAPELINDLINDCFCGSFPSSILQSAVVLIPKKDGDTRPICLTSLVAKLFESIWLGFALPRIHDQQILKPFQVGFRKREGTCGPLSCLDISIRQARQQGKSIVVVALDLSAAYCSVKRGQLLVKLASFGLEDDLLCPIASFLTHRTFFCRKDGFNSRVFPQERGLPQGSLSSPLLFNLFLSDIPTPQNAHDYILAYADDILLVFESSSFEDTIDNINSYLNSLAPWLSHNNLALNPSKCFAFTPNKRNDDNLPPVVIQGAPILFSKSLTYLGVCFGKFGSFREHVASNVVKTQRSARLFMRFCNKLEGLSIDGRVKLFSCYLRPRLEYGLNVIRLKSTELNSIALCQRRLLKRLLHAPMNTNTKVLEAITRLPPITERLRLLAVRAAFRTLSSPQCQTYHSWLSHPSLYLRPSFWRNQGIAPLWLQFFASYWPYVQRNLHRLHLQNPPASTEFVLENWLPSKQQVNDAGRSWPQIFDSTFQRTFPTTQPVIIATDGSCKGAASAMGISSPLGNRSARLPDFTPIMHAELAAIDLAISLVSSSACPRAVILSDSASAIAFLKNASETPESLYFRTRISQLGMSCQIHLAWIPGHAGISQNEAADELAKRGLDLALVEESLPPCVTLPQFVCAVARRELMIGAPLQSIMSLDSKHHHLKFATPDRVLSIYRPYKFEWFLFRLRINRPPMRVGKSRFGDRAGNCRFCPDKPLTTSHLMSECPFLLPAQVLLQHEVCTISDIDLPSTYAIFSHCLYLSPNLPRAMQIASAIKNFLHNIIFITCQSP